VTASRQVKGLLAAWSWLDRYEADAPAELAEKLGAPDWAPLVSLGAAVRETVKHYEGSSTKATAAVVAARYPAFPRDMVDGWFELQRLVERRTLQAERRRNGGR